MHVVGNNGIIAERNHGSSWGCIDRVLDSLGVNQSAINADLAVFCTELNWQIRDTVENRTLTNVCNRRVH